MRFLGIGELLALKYGKRDIQSCAGLLVHVRNLCSKTEITNPQQKAIRVAIIGVPNAGKSTFINGLINHRVCPTSNKVHTTRKASKAVCTVNDSQVILFDTPGLVTSKEIKKHHLESSFTRSYRHSIQHSNLIGVIHDVSNHWQRNELHHTVLETLNAYPKLPSFLVLNKIDTLKSKRLLLELIKVLTNNSLSAKTRVSKDVKSTENKELKDVKGWDNFSAVFMVSSLLGDGMNEVMKFILNQAKPSQWEYAADTHTDVKPEELIVDSVRARLLDYLPQEIPYSLRTAMEYYNVEHGIIYAYVNVSCPNQRIERLVTGVSNGKLKQITERITSDLVETFKKPVSLTIATNVKHSLANKN